MGCGMEYGSYRIMYFLDYGRRVGGAVNTLLRRVLQMKKRGMQVQLVISKYMQNNISDDFQKIFAERKLNVWELSYPISTQTEDIDIISVIDSYDEVKAAVKEYNPNILHSVQINPVAELVSRELGIPHVMDIYQAINDFFSLNYLNIFAHYHICDSKMYEEMWKKNLHTESRCIRTIAFQIQPKRTLSYEEQTKFICVGSFGKYKNQLMVIKAFHMAISAGIKGSLAFYGYCNGLYAQECLKYIKDNNLSQFISLKGFCADMQSVYNESEVLLCGSKRESYPNVISEALASGNIIISTPVAGVPEVIKDGYNGFVCDGFEAQDICNKIFEYYDLKRERKINRILENAYETYQSVHSPEIVAEQLLNFYEYIIDNYFNPNEDLQIEQVMNSFKNIVDRYYVHLHSFTYPVEVKRKLWYLHHIYNPVALNKGKKFYIWGTGRQAVIAKEIVDIFFGEIKLEGFIDSYKKGYYMEYLVLNPKEVLKDTECVIFIAARNSQQEIMAELAKAGKKFNIDYFLLASRVW